MLSDKKPLEGCCFGFKLYKGSTKNCYPPIGLVLGLASLITKEVGKRVFKLMNPGKELSVDFVTWGMSVLVLAFLSAFSCTTAD